MIRRIKEEGNEHENEDEEKKIGGHVINKIISGARKSRQKGKKGLLCTCSLTKVTGCHCRRH